MHDYYQLTHRSSSIGSSDCTELDTWTQSVVTCCPTWFRERLAEFLSYGHTICYSVTSMLHELQCRWLAL